MTLHQESEFVQLNKILSQKQAKTLPLCPSWDVYLKRPPQQKKFFKVIILLISSGWLTPCLMSSSELWFVTRNSESPCCNLFKHCSWLWNTSCRPLSHSVWKDAVLPKQSVLGSTAHHSCLHVVQPLLLYKLPLRLLPPMP